MTFSNDGRVILQVHGPVDVNFYHHIGILNRSQDIVLREVTQLTLYVLSSDLTLAVKTWFAFNEIVVVVATTEACSGNKTSVRYCYDRECMLPGSQDSLLVRAPDSSSKGYEFESRQKRRGNVLVQS